MRAAGLEPGDYEDEVFEVWPENWPVARLFGRLGTQWHESINGPTGLHYDSVTLLLDRSGHAGDEWWQMFDDICLMESVALQVMREN